MAKELIGLNEFRYSVSMKLHRFFSFSQVVEEVQMNFMINLKETSSNIERLWTCNQTH